MSDGQAAYAAAYLPCHIKITDDGPGVVVMFCVTHHMPLARDSALTLAYAMALAYTHTNKVEAANDRLRDDLTAVTDAEREAMRRG